MSIEDIRDFKWDGDLVFEDGELVMVEGAEALRQRLESRLQIWQGEWFRDTTMGLPYRQLWFVKNPNLNAIDLSLRTAILQDGAFTIKELSIAYDETIRKVTITGVLSYDGGTLAITSDTSPTIYNSLMLQVSPMGPY